MANLQRDADYRLRVPLLTLQMTTLTMSCLIGVALIAGFAIADMAVAFRCRRRWKAGGHESVSRRAAHAVVEARAGLAAAIEADDRAQRSVRRHPALGNLSPGNPSAGSRSPGKRSPGTDAGFVDAGFVDAGLDRRPSQREAAREVVLDAQRLWESVRPQRDTNARVGLWSGRGRLRSWQLGPVGFERVIVRFDHLVDPDCWVLNEYRHVRFGLGLGVESLDLAVFAAATPSRRLDELTRGLLGGPEVAFRPGAAPLRWWRTTRRSDTAQAATQAVFADRQLDLHPSPQTTAAMWAAVHEDFGPDAATTGLGGLTEPIAVAHTCGPSLLFGAWWGAGSRRRLVAASSHVVWRDPS